ncbi:MAG: DUF6340 family protein [Prolixibacteraceae bacterium]|jgi:hypothetical protein
MKRKSGILWFVLLLSLSSCVSYENFSIEVFKPAKYTIPPDIHKVAIVSRNLKYENDTLQNYQVINRHLVKDKIKFDVDSLAIKTCLDSLEAKLLVNSRFDSILVLPVNSFPEARVKEIRPDKAGWYQKLTGETGADGLLLLDMFSSFYSNLEGYNSGPLVSVISSNIWSFYDGKQQKITNRYVLIDTLYWDGTDVDGHIKRLRIPGKKAAIQLAAGISGQKYARHIVPAWTMVDRKLMTCKKPEFEKAASLAQKTKWEEASVIWQKYAESKNRQDQIIALYNLALSSEMAGNIDLALDYTGRAAKASSGAFWTDENDAVKKYSAKLYRRQIEINQLKNTNESR